MRLSFLALAATLATVFSVAPSSTAVPLEPTSGIYIGAWLDTAPGRADSPVQLNQRLGFNASFFQLGENFPLNFNEPPPVSLIDATNTDAILYLSVYPTSSIYNVADSDISALVDQLGGWAKANRSVILRFGAEMNGSWQPYGQRPLGFVALWRRVVTAVRNNQYTKDKVAFLWGPNMGAGYPYSGGVYSMNQTTNATEFAALDTNNNQQLDAGDDPYSPYYPGNDYVDWVGISSYWFGPTYPYVTNVVPGDQVLYNLIHGITVTGTTVDFYATYAAANTKPFFITETGAAYHEYLITSVADPVKSGDVAAGASELTMKQTWWRQWLSNTTFHQQHPLLKGVCLFEFEKPEETTYRDFRVTNKTDILAAFKADFADPTVHSQFIYGQPATISSGSGSTSGSAPGSSPGRTQVNSASGLTDFKTFLTGITSTALAFVWSIY